MMDTYSGYCGHPAPGIATGKPVSLGGSLGRRESTGRGVAYLVNQASGTTGLDITRATVVIQGFGNVGSVAALALAKYGAKIVAVSDVYGGLYNAQGLNLAALEKHFAQHNTVVGFPEAEPIANDQLLLLRATFWCRRRWRGKSLRPTPGNCNAASWPRAPMGPPPRKRMPFCGNARKFS